jgi:hypothetical protein
MKIIKTFALLLCLLSSLAQAETTLFGLTLGKSTLQEVQQTYTLKYINNTPGLLDSWNYYRVSGEQFNEPQLHNATLFFDDAQTLGNILFIFSGSLSKYKELEEQLSRQYPRIKISERFGNNRTDYKNDTTHVSLAYTNNGTTLTFTDLKYRAAAFAVFENNVREASNPKKEP